MIVLEKKKIVYVIGIISICLLTLIGVECVYRFNNKNANISIETVALPVNNKVIIIDAGHGIPDERCRKYESD